MNQQHVAAAFTEWERRAREEPSRFMTESQRFATDTSTYGEQCAAYFLQVLNEVAR